MLESWRVEHNERRPHSELGYRTPNEYADENARFHHVSNAYVADLALFPTIGSANPALTGLTLARKVAGDRVRNGHANRPGIGTLGPSACLFGNGILRRLLPRA